MKALTFIAGAVLLPLLAACGEEPWHSDLNGRFGESEMQTGSWASTVCDDEALDPGVSVECGILTVREVRDDSSSRKLLLPVKRYFGLAGRQAPAVFFLSGGPGQSNMNATPAPELLRNFSYILVGYRGVDGSVKLDCPEFVKALPKIERFFSEDYIAAVAASFDACLGRYHKEGIAIDGYTMPEVIGDIEAARKALGYERVSLLSQSYGTRIALLYAHTKPEHIDRSVLLKANPPGRMVWDSAQTDDKIRKLARYCANDPACASRTDNLAETVNTVLRNPPDRWLFLKIDPGRVRAASFMLLYSAGSMPMFADAFLDAEAGDASGLALLSKSMDFFGLSGAVWGDLVLKAATADFDSKNSSADIFYPESAIIGAPMSELLWPALTDDKIRLIPEIYREPQTSDVPTLIISGELDVSTPPENARDDILPYLSKSYQVTIPAPGTRISAARRLIGSPPNSFIQEQGKPMTCRGSLLALHPDSHWGSSPECWWAVYRFLLF